LIRVDDHPSFQQIAFFVEETGGCGKRQLSHREGKAERFYRDLQQSAIRLRVGMGAKEYAGSSEVEHRPLGLCWFSLKWTAGALRWRV
jgi:hypothetical protein